MTDEAAVTKILLDRYGRTYAEQAGIRLTGWPSWSTGRIYPGSRPR